MKLKSLSLAVTAVLATTALTACGGSSDNNVNTTPIVTPTNNNTSNNTTAETEAQKALAEAQAAAKAAQEAATKAQAEAEAAKKAQEEAEAKAKADAEAAKKAQEEAIAKALADKQKADEEAAKKAAEEAAKGGQQLADNNATSNFTTNTPTVLGQQYLRDSRSAFDLKETNKTVAEEQSIGTLASNVPLQDPTLSNIVLGNEVNSRAKVHGRYAGYVAVHAGEIDIANDATLKVEDIEGNDKLLNTLSVVTNANNLNSVKTDTQTEFTVADSPKNSIQNHNSIKDLDAVTSKTTANLYKYGMYTGTGVTNFDGTVTSTIGQNINYKKTLVDVGLFDYQSSDKIVPVSDFDEVTVANQAGIENKLEQDRKYVFDKDDPTKHVLTGGASATAKDVSEFGDEADARVLGKLFNAGNDLPANKDKANIFQAKGDTFYLFESLTGTRLNNVQFGRVSNQIDPLTEESTENASKYVIAPWISRNADGAVSTYFYRGLNPTSVAEMTAVMEKNKDNKINYYGQALTYGINGATGASSGILSNALGAASYTHTIGDFVEATFDVNNKLVTGNIYNVKFTSNDLTAFDETITDKKKALAGSKQNLISFKGDVTGNTILGTSTKLVGTSDVGSFQGSFYGKEATELGGAVNAVNKGSYGLGEWGAVFGAKAETIQTPKATVNVATTDLPVSP